MLPKRASSISKTSASVQMAIAKTLLNFVAALPKNYLIMIFPSVVLVLLNWATLEVNWVYGPASLGTRSLMGRG